MEKNFYMPAHLHQPFRLIIFTLDECLVFGVPFALGFMLNAVLVGFTVGPFLLFAWRHVKGDRKGYCFLTAFTYWYVPLLSTLRNSPLSSQREYLG